MFRKHKPKSTPFTNNGNNTSETSENNNRYPSAPPPPQSPSSPSSQLVFHCQLSDGSPTAFVSGFSNVKELYQKIAEQFDMPVTEVNKNKLNNNNNDASYDVDDDDEKSTY